MQDFKIGFYSNLMGAGVNHGYGYAAVQLIQAWQRQGVPVWTWDMSAPVGFNFVQPTWYELAPDRPLNIGYTPWESTKVPSGWDWYMNQMHEIWVPSEANKEWYIQNGIKRPIRVLHHGINRKHWPRAKRNANKGPIRFLTVGAEAKRKGAHRAVEAFKAAFPNPTKSGVSMTLKGQPWWNYTRTKGVHLVTEFLTHRQMTNLYLKHHAMFYPTNGEGFGFIPFDAMATGMPTWVTDWSGPKDFMDYGWPIPVKKMIEADYHPHEGMWAEPDFDSMVESMRHFVAAPETFFNASWGWSGEMDEHFSWDSIAKKSIGWMQEILEKPTAC